MKALARYQLILLGEQRHTGVNNLPKVVARQCRSRESNPQSADCESETLPLHHRATYIVESNLFLRPTIFRNTILLSVDLSVCQTV